MKRKRKLKKKFVVFLSLYALFFVSYFTLTTLAKYTTTVLNRSGNIPVAKWDVSIAGEDNETLPTMFIGQSNTYQSYELSVTSKSEVAVNYSVIISNVPSGVQIQVDDNERLYSGDTITLENLGTLKATENESQTRKHKFTILVPSDAGIVPFTDHPLDIDVIFTQVEI